MSTSKPTPSAAPDANADALYTDPLSPRSRRLAQSAAIASVSVATLLVAVKFAAWLATDSVAMLSSLMDSALDGFASVVTLFALRLSYKPADSDHRFGHGKAQPLAALAQAAFIAGSGAFLMIQAIERLIRPQPISNSETGIAVVVFSIAVTLGLVAWQRHVARQTGSMAVKADMAHYAGDLLANIGVIAGLVLAGLVGWLWADPVLAMAVALYLLYGAWDIARESLDVLMDREMEDADRERITAIALGFAQVEGVHGLRTRRSGTHTFIQLDLVLNGAMSLIRAHAIGDAVAKEIARFYPDAQVTIHHDPAQDDSAMRDGPQAAG